MSSSPPQKIRRPRICFVAHQHVATFATPILAEYEALAEIEVVEGILDDALIIAQERIQKGAVDVFISAGANASILRQNLSVPVAVIQVDGFSLMQALLKARETSHRVGIVTYGRTIPELEDIKEILKLEVVQYAYQNLEHAQACFARLKQDGFTVIIGSSLVVEMARNNGLSGLLAYSLNGLRRGLDEAIELARVTRLEAGRHQQLNGVLSNLQDAVLAVDRNHCITAINPHMQRLLGKKEGSLLGQPLHKVEPELSLLNTIETGLTEHTQVLRFAQKDWIANRTPIREYGEIVGAALTLYDAQAIAEADTSLRMQQRKRQNTAKYTFEHLIGNSPAMMQAIETARRFARTEHTLLIRGESGTGKELFAQAIHNESRRAQQAFIALNCAAFPESLLESELFGYEEGAFTGSRRGGKPGLFEAAHKGTLFLDEIGDIPMPLQTRLLRVLQEREIIRVGAISPIPIDVRVIAATHQPLEEMMAAQRFRQDLYYRINTLRLSLPPLRARRDDIGPLAATLVARALHQLNSALDADQALVPLLPYLQAYHWPGNVRELENICDRIAVFLYQFSTQAEINYETLRYDCPELFLPDTPMLDSSENSRKAYLQEVLKETYGNRADAAKKLGISRSTLWRWLKEMETP